MFSIYLTLPWYTYVSDSKKRSAASPRYCFQVSTRAPCTEQTNTAVACLVFYGGPKLGQCHYPRLGLLHDQFYVKRIVLCQYHHHRQHVTNCYSGYVYNSSRLPLQGVSPSKTGATTPSTTTTSSPSPNSREAYLTSVSSKHCEDGT